MTKRKKNPFERQNNNRRAPAPGSETSPERPNLATINLQAGAGRQGLRVGDTARIEGTGLYAGQTATIERLIAGVIPSAFVRTESGNSRQVRTIDLTPAPKPEAAKPTS
jgi:hypothetical protein